MGLVGAAASLLGFQSQRRAVLEVLEILSLGFDLAERLAQSVLGVF